MTILLRETSPDAKFELFQRLNSAGTALSGQELRNAILSGNQSPMLNWLEELANYESFKKVAKLSENQEATRYDMELVLRFVVLLSQDNINAIRQSNSIDVFLTHVMRDMTAPDYNFDYESFGNIFKKTFKLIDNSFGEKALKYQTRIGNGKFSIACFEAIALGIAQNIELYDEENTNCCDQLKEKIESLPKQNDFSNYSKSGVSTKQRIEKLLAFGKKYFGNLN